MRNRELCQGWIMSIDEENIWERTGYK